MWCKGPNKWVREQLRQHLPPHSYRIQWIYTQSDLLYEITIRDTVPEHSLTLTRIALSEYVLDEYTVTASTKQGLNIRVP